MTTHIPRKRFGQHFLHDRGVILRIVQAIDPRPGQRIVEIGPGLGALTLPVLERCKRMDVVELDRDVIPHLIAACEGRGELVVHQVDALQFRFADLAGPDERLRVIGNLPYNISTPLMFHLFDQTRDDRPVISDMTFMLQLEVCQRLAAAPNTEHYGRLSVMAQYHARIEFLFHVGRGAFNPPPRVESGIVRLTPHGEPPVDVGDKGLFDRMVAQAFNMRRKTLRNGLKGFVDAAGFEAAGIDPVRRPETLSLEEFATLSRVACGSGLARDGGLIASKLAPTDEAP
ncbi:MAG: 16S rRNA (adenine(1518)-N(6)/adenine(1519)-N(6))-dimethyltransferase RsmA [Halothiobacillaceae bacterium]|nr:MAG: 16S rRNA (adenine(1518)-N(6)/adenine(1519)-N(6))-dimethyltransferase RsmA [Halothiobacillaceae bacterium]